MTSPILRFLTEHPVWTLEETVLRQLCGILNRHLAGVRLSAEEIRAATSARADTDAEPDDVAYTFADGLAVVPIAGVIVRHAGMVNGMSQPRGTAVEVVRAALADAVDRPDVQAILLHINSPGGSVDGVADLADEIEAADAVKPVVALIDGVGASAAYWLACGARHVFATQSSLAGSIGAYMTLVDSSGKAEREGVRVLVVASGQHKGAGVPGTAITPEQVEAVAQVVNDCADQFKAAVVTARPQLLETIDALATGAVFSAARAVDAGLLDAVATFTEAATYALELAEDADSPRPLSQENHMLGKKKPESAAPDAATLLATERQRVAAIMAALPDEVADARQAAIADGLTVEQAKALAFDSMGALIDTQAATHATALAAVETKLADAQGRLDALATAGTEIKPDIPDDADPTPKEQDADEAKAKEGEDLPAAYEALVATKVAAMGPDGSKADAIRAVSTERPDLHEAWLEAQSERKTNSL